MVELRHLDSDFRSRKQQRSRPVWSTAYRSWDEMGMDEGESSKVKMTDYEERLCVNRVKGFGVTKRS